MLESRIYIDVLITMVQLVRLVAALLLFVFVHVMHSDSESFGHNVYMPRFGDAESLQLLFIKALAPHVALPTDTFFGRLAENFMVL
jgi:hypothetical protein